MRQICVTFTECASFLRHAIDSLAGFYDIKNSFPDAHHSEKIPVDQTFEVPPCCRCEYIGELLIVRIGDFPGFFRKKDRGACAKHEYQGGDCRQWKIFYSGEIQTLGNVLELSLRFSSHILAAFLAADRDHREQQLVFFRKFPGNAAYRNHTRVRHKKVLYLTGDTQDAVASHISSFVRHKIMQRVFAQFAGGNYDKPGAGYRALRAR